MSSLKSLRELVYENGWAKVELESFILVDESGKECSKRYLLPIFYVKIGNGCILKATLNGSTCDREKTFLIDDNDLSVDSYLTNEGRPVLDDGLGYSDSFDHSNYSISIPEPCKPHYRKTILCNDRGDLPVEIENFIKEEVLVGNANVA